MPTVSATALDLREDVGREEDSAALASRLAHQGKELTLHDRVQPCGRLVKG